MFLVTKSNLKGSNNKNQPRREGNIYTPVPSISSSGLLSIDDTLQVVFEEVKLQFEILITFWRVSEFLVARIILIVARFGLMANGHMATRGNHQGAQAIHEEL